ncbi:hypothetical protein W02_40710 [Nitrospira sp. KM1]|uniref:YEATS-associated helix-containing protein n=1 Tax=Nitrospira sp. KM1 TaxID=1936990 RepID=UPI0013A7198C|nr:YEATS-associated helix-containing protein [Nitrospira sp. KM1]BCA56931.1 hypothetical protein W02_40710 [Nitrospira sp. KM1]
MIEGILQIVPIMVTAGLLGAAASTALNKDERSWEAFKWNCVIGVSASFLIPVLLTTVSSNVLQALTDGSAARIDKYLVFAGYCLLGAISAQRLITTLSEKVLQIAKDARTTAQEAKAEAEQSRESVEETKQVVLETRASAEQTKKVVLATKDAIQYGIKEDDLGKPVPASVPHLDKALVDAAFKTDDPWKGKFDGKAEANGRRLDAEVTRLTDLGDTASISLRVISMDPLRPLTGTVQFYIHQSFGKYDPLVPVIEGKALLNLTSWGAFTVGAVCDDGTKLELDLSEHPDAWEPWKSR